MSLGTSSERDDDGLELLWRTLHAPDGRTASCRKCGTARLFHRVTARRAYACDRCGTHIYPASSTPFSGSPIPLATWLDALVTVCETPERQRSRRLAETLGLGYKKAWRMARRIDQGLAAGSDTEALLRGLAQSWRSATRPRAATPRPPEDRIRAAACRVMAENGLTSTRIAAIAHEAGVSSASIHYYFRSKDELLLEAFRWAGEQLHLTLSELRDAHVGPLDHLRRLLELSVPSDETLHREYLLWLEVWVRVRNHSGFLDECDAMSERWSEAVLEVFGRGIEAGVFTPVAELEEICERYVAISESLAYRAALRYAQMPTEKARRILARFTAEQLGIPAGLLTTTRTEGEL
jgi:AcrR family transcriptional regulator